jgi:hypothetical protein
MYGGAKTAQCTLHTNDKARRLAIIIDNNIDKIDHVSREQYHNICIKLLKIIVFLLKRLINLIIIFITLAA